MKLSDENHEALMNTIDLWLDKQMYPLMGAVICPLCIVGCTNCPVTEVFGGSCSTRGIVPWFDWREARSIKDKKDAAEFGLLSLALVLTIYKEGL